MDNKNETRQDKSDPGWHRWFGSLFKEILTPLGLDVQTEMFVMTDPPRADVVIIRKPVKEWTKEQLMFLPDGIRDSRAGHVIIEFKHTESLDKDTFCKVLGYRVFYKQHYKLKDHEVQSFLVSSKTPAKKTLSRYGYTLTSHDGIFESHQEFSDLITVVSLNDLADAQHNAFVGLFGSKKKAKLRALGRLGAMTPDMMAHVSERPMRFISRIAEFLMIKGGDDMEELTPEEKETIANILNHWIIPYMTIDKRLEGLTLDDILAKYDQEEVLARYNKDEVLARYNKDEVFSKYKPEEIEAYLKSLKKNQ